MVGASIVQARGRVTGERAGAASTRGGAVDGRHGCGEATTARVERWAVGCHVPHPGRDTLRAPTERGHDGKGGVVLSKLTKLTITRGDGAGVLRGALTMGRLEALSTSWVPTGSDPTRGIWDGVARAFRVLQEEDIVAWPADRRREIVGCMLRRSDVIEGVVEMAPQGDGGAPLADAGAMQARSFTATETITYGIAAGDCRQRGSGSVGP